MANGYRRGFWLSLFQYAGLVAGVVAGAALGPAILDALHLTDGVRPLAAVLVLVVCGSLGSTFGFWIGEPVRRSILGSGFARPPEKLAGGLFSMFTVLSVTWFLGLTFSEGPSQDLSRQIQRSSILHSVDLLFPRPPGFMSGVKGILAGVPFPQTFAGLEPTFQQPLQPPASVDTPAVAAADEVVYRVEGRGCGGTVSGSAYPVAKGYLVTNAHVVSGTMDTTLSQDGPRPTAIPARVVLFDKDRDVAVLYAPGVAAPALTPSAGQRGTQGAVIGYPGGGAETTGSAVIDEQITAQGRDIYNDQLVNRNIWILGASVHPGNSGGPLIDLQGHVLGMVYAASGTDPNQAYALTNDEIQADIDAGIGRTSRVATETFPCAV